MKDSQKQVIKYTIIGISAVLVDFVVYYACSFFLESIDLAKAVGFITGSFYTFFLNKFWTWKDTRKTGITQLSKFFAIYGVSLVINIAVNKAVISLIPNYTIDLIISDSFGYGVWKSAFLIDKFLAFFIATAASAVWNFSDRNTGFSKSEHLLI